MAKGYTHTAKQRALAIFGTRIDGLAQEDFIVGVESLSVEQPERIAIDYRMFTGVRQLELRCKRPYPLPESILEMRALQRLRLQNCLLPADIERLQSLRALESDGIADMPAGLSKLPLQEFVFIYYDKRLPAIPCPDFIYSLQSLERLELRLCRLCTLDSRLNDLQNLRSLNFGCSLSDLDELPDITSLQRLERLQARGEAVQGQRLPPYRLLQRVLDNVAGLPQLRALDLAGWAAKRKDEWLVLAGKRRSIPDVFAGLQQLEELSLHGMRLDFLPPSISALPRLRTLNLGGNHLSPEELAAFAQTRPDVELLYADRNKPRFKAKGSSGTA